MHFCNILGDLAECLCDKSKICFKDVHSKTNLTERTALHFAARYDKYYCVNSLVEAGADGIVFGCLDKQANIDVNGCKLILDAVKNNPINLTFHRAFDVVQDPIKTANVIKELGFTRILTSGQVSR